MLSNNPLPVVEIFGITLQGEGPSFRPSIFVRLGGCNMKCKGFGCHKINSDGEDIIGCDTIYAVDPSFKPTWEHLNAEDILERIQNRLGVRNPQDVDIVLTGGEPLLHWKNNQLHQLIQTLVSLGHNITIETNGSVALDPNIDPEILKHLTFSVSIKLAVSLEPKKKRINEKAIAAWAQLPCYLKFVVDPKTWIRDSKEVYEILDLFKKANPNKTPVVYLMPIGGTREEQIQNMAFVFDQCTRNGFNFSPRIHILAFDTLVGI